MFNIYAVVSMDLINSFLLLFKKFSFVYMHVCVHVCLSVHMSHSAHVKVQNNPRESVLSLHRVCPKLSWQ